MENGFTCPKCGQYIPVDHDQVLHDRDFTCPYCEKHHEKTINNKP